MFYYWKLFSLLAGIALLIAGAEFYHFCDWDIGISIIMAVLTYLFAPFTVRTVWFRQWHRLPLALFLMWLAVDGCYVAYHTAMGNDMIRDANAACSSFLYLICGVIWSYNGSLRSFTEHVKQASLQELGSCRKPVVEAFYGTKQSLLDLLHGRRRAACSDNRLKGLIARNCHGVNWRE